MDNLNSTHLYGFALSPYCLSMVKTASSHSCNSSGVLAKQTYRPASIGPWCTAGVLVRGASDDKKKRERVPPG